MQEGNWAKAVIYALILLLTECHKRQLIHLRPGKTNRNYLGELKQAPSNVRSALSNSINIFERSFFGHIAITEQEAQALYKNVRNTCDHLQRQANT